MSTRQQLTAKQEKFCQGLVDGLSATESYKQSYNTENMNPTTIRREAYELTRRDDITQRVKELKKPLENHYYNTAQGEIEESKRFLWGVVHNDSEKTENRLRALDMLNRMNQAYKDDTQQDDTANSIDNLDTDKLIQLVNTA